MVDGILPGQDQLGDGHQSIVLLDQVLQDRRQRLRRMLGSVVEKDDGPGLDLGGHPLGNVRRRKILPVQGVNVPHNFKKGLPKIFVPCYYKINN